MLYEFLDKAYYNMSGYFKNVIWHIVNAPMYTHVYPCIPMFNVHMYLNRDICMKLNSKYTYTSIIRHRVIVIFSIWSVWVESIIWKEYEIFNNADTAFVSIWSFSSVKHFLSVCIFLFTIIPSSFLPVVYFPFSFF